MATKKNIELANEYITLLSQKKNLINKLRVAYVYLLNKAPNSYYIAELETKANAILSGKNTAVSPKRIEAAKRVLHIIGQLDKVDNLIKVKELYPDVSIKDIQDKG